MVAGVKLINMVIKKNRKKIKYCEVEKIERKMNRDKYICIERVRGRGEKE